MEYAKVGAKALDTGDLQTAIVEYTKALIEHPTSPDYYTQRSICFNRLKPPRHDLALQDAETAVLCGQKRGKRDKIQAGQQRRVVGLYNIGRYADAKFVLDSMKRWRPTNSKPQEMEHNMWNTKIEGKLKTNQQESTVSEYPSQGLQDESVIKKALQKQLRPDGTFNYEGEEVEMAESANKADENIAATTVSADTDVTSTATVPSIPKDVRHEWYQNKECVIITVYAKGVPKDKAQIEVEEDSVSITFPQPSDPSSTYSFTLDPLFALIDPSRSKHQIMKTKVELTLAKTVQDQKWRSLEGTAPLKDVGNSAGQDPAAKAAVMSTIGQPSNNAQPATAPAYPSSSKTGPKNWDKLANELTAKKSKKAKEKRKENDGSDVEDADDDDDYDSDMGGDAVDGFFKKLYAGSDPDTQRAMMKSYQESNGTALSTNWSEVGRGKVEEVKSKDD